MSVFRCFLSADLHTSESKSRATRTSQGFRLEGSATSVTLATAVALLVVGAAILLWRVRLCKGKASRSCECQPRAVSL